MINNKPTVQPEVIKKPSRMMNIKENVISPKNKNKKINFEFNVKTKKLSKNEGKL